MMKPTLVVMAAGVGSRYGGLKQIDPVGPNGEIIIDYSIYDAIKAGFGKIIFVIKEDMHEIFRDNIGKRIEKIVDTAYVYQKLENLPFGFNVPLSRKKPWGTAHAVLSCQKVVNTPFVVINADDFYGLTSFQTLYESLVMDDTGDFKCEYSMIGYKLENTLTEHGSVARGICTVDSKDYLLKIQERTQIKKVDCGAKYTEDGESWIDIPKPSIASMNIWGFNPSIFTELEINFTKFLQSNVTNLEKAEYYIPNIIDCLIVNNKAKVKVLKSNEQWYGVTYQEDKPLVKAAIKSLITKGIYPSNLWEEL